ncbi:MAG: ABC transporter permease subunit [Ignavibacteriaceae bacterium]|nr:ABC transporter permease subunit [Ignavibacteriaceae bacterium]
MLKRLKLTFNFFLSSKRKFSVADTIIIIALGVLLYIGIEFALKGPIKVTGPNISLSPKSLPLYTLFSVTRMFTAYVLSIIFTLFYGRIAAQNRKAEKVMLPILDVLQSVPILSFLPVVVLSLRAILPQGIAAELGSVILIFTSQVWNMTFAWYQSLKTVPQELTEASSIFRLNGWMRIKTLEVPFAVIPLIWNSIMSWAGGWFFLMAAEIFTVGNKDFRLPGLGSYLQEAANKGNFTAIFFGIGTLIFVIVALDQLVWRPLLAWSDKYKLEMVEGEEPPTSWFYDLIQSSDIIYWIHTKIFMKINERIDTFLIKAGNRKEVLENEPEKSNRVMKVFILIIGAGFLYGIVKASNMLSVLAISDWLHLATGVLSTFTRVIISLIIALLWTVPIGVAIGTNRKVATFLQPLVQIFASIPATALFPVLLLFILKLPNGLNIAAVVLMLMGTQWYLLFNIIAGASAIPQDLKYTAELMKLSRWGKWKTLILPSLFPFLITGAIAASGGAWNASIVAEYVNFGGTTMSAHGVGAVISGATADGNYPLLLAGTLSMVVTVVLINRLVWRRLYTIAEEKYKME